MKPGALITQSFRSIWNNKVRSFLTILGIVIGIAAVLLLVGLGNSLKANVMKQVGNLDATRILVNSKDPEQQTAEKKGGRFTFNSKSGVEKLTIADYNDIKKVKNVSLASPESNAIIDVTTSPTATKATAYQLYGVDASYFDINKYKAAKGSLFSASDVSSSQPVVVVGKKAADKLFPNIDAVGKTIYMKDVAYKIVGVLEEPSDKNAFSNDIALHVFTGYKTWGNIQEKDKLGSVQVNATSEESVEQVGKDLESLLLSKHKITDTNKADFVINTNKDLLATLSNVSGSFATTLTGIATISLIVGGIGIMNIMLVTVTERTREIGLRRAVGAKKRHIVMQFLTESMLLTTIGGLGGVLIGIGFNKQAAEFFNSVPAGVGNSAQIFIDLPTVLLAVGISIAIGVIFGLFPAIKAARLDPAEALRYE